MSDTYKRREVTPGVYQCGCYWEKRNDEFGKGDVLVECKIHRQATIASVNNFERQRPKTRSNK